MCLLWKGELYQDAEELIGAQGSWREKDVNI